MLESYGPARVHSSPPFAKLGRICQIDASTSGRQPINGEDIHLEPSNNRRHGPNKGADSFTLASRTGILPLVGSVAEGVAFVNQNGSDSSQPDDFASSGFLFVVGSALRKMAISSASAVRFI